MLARLLCNQGTKAIIGGKRFFAVQRLSPTILKHVPNRDPFRGPLKAAILDWSGTTADAHVLAPAVVFVEVFKKHGVPIRYVML